MPVDLVESLQRETIERHGGMHGLRDRGLLESAVALDGNKRIGFAALTTFLDLNGWQLVCSEAEETAAVLRVAAGEMTEAEWTAWVVRSVGRL